MACVVDLGPGYELARLWAQASGKGQETGSSAKEAGDPASYELRRSILEQGLTCTGLLSVFLKRSIPTDPVSSCGGSRLPIAVQGKPTAFSRWTLRFYDQNLEAKFGEQCDEAARPARDGIWPSGSELAHKLGSRFSDRRNGPGSLFRGLYGGRAFYELSSHISRSQLSPALMFLLCGKLWCRNRSSTVFLCGLPTLLIVVAHLMSPFLFRKTDAVSGS